MHLATLDGCPACPLGYQLKKYLPTGEQYCEPSCDIDNGGCDDDKDCSLRSVTCPPNRPCPPVVQCLVAGEL